MTNYLSLRLAAVTASIGTFAACSDISPTLDLLHQDAGGRVVITPGAGYGVPGFVRTQLPRAMLGDAASVEQAGRAFFDRYGSLFGLRDGARELRHVGTRSDRLGLRHVRFQQTVGGVDVYGGDVTLHLDAGRNVVAVTNGAVPVHRISTRPRITRDDAVRTAARYLPGAELVSAPLTIYPGREAKDGATLVWLVELRDDAVPVRRAYAIDARSGRVTDVLDRTYSGRQRLTYSANHDFDLPGTLRRGESDAATGDDDIDNAHEFAGATYDYFSLVHGRDSYDGRGAALVSTAHYRSNFNNAFWTGEQMVYGDGYTVKDVVAHELTHAVTEYSAKLEYRWQSGALNESYSDIFGAMVDRDGWLLGEGLPGGPIRNMEDPTQFGHPAHTDDWRASCGDNEGVHINSGIHNKAYVTIAEDIGKEPAEKIFFRALTEYLGVRSTFEDSRSAAVQAATDLYGENSGEVQSVEAGFASVGVDGSFDPGPGCGRSVGDDRHGHQIALPRGGVLVTLLTAMALFLGVRGWWRASQVV